MTLLIHAAFAALIFFAAMDIILVAGVAACTFVALRFYLYTRGIDLRQWWFILWSHAPARKDVSETPKGVI
jgi:hypothetical protein